HQQEPRSRMALDQASRVQRVRAADQRRAQVHLHGYPALAGQRAEAVDDEVAECLPLRRRRIRRAPCPPGKLLVGLVEAEIAVVGERVLERDLMPLPKGVDEVLEEGDVVVEARELRAEPPRELVAAVAVVVADLAVPGEGERVD